MIGLYIFLFALIIGVGVILGWLAIETIIEGEPVIGIGLLIVVVGMVVGLCTLLICNPIKTEEAPPQPTEVVVRMAEE